MWEEERDFDLDDELPTYEELAFDPDEPDAYDSYELPMPEPHDRPVPPHSRRRTTDTAIVTFILALVALWATGMLLHQQYDNGYANGERDGSVQAWQAGEQQGMHVGYQDGEHQGKLEEQVGLQEYLFSHGCATDAQGYVRFKVMKDGEQYRYECAIDQSKK